MLFDPFVPFNTVFQTGGRAGFLPSVDLTVSENDMVLTMDVPGLAAEDVEIQVLNDELIVRGERKRPALSEGAKWAHNERSFGTFERRVRLPRGVDPDAVSASMDNGVLSLMVPKPEVLKPRTITIGSGTEQRELEPAAA